MGFPTLHCDINTVCSAWDLGLRLTLLQFKLAPMK